ncbi:MAG: hypothetical protein PF690_01695 [Deltaproteobacteria bacterium]|jgi:hypothetical protein|nr:hypothetical protein [Deltaproteobacteria bacterium]
MIFDNKYICPPGSSYSHLESPDGKGNSIEVALMMEHRFVFYYWFKWSKYRFSQNDIAPALISIDWHQDLCSPCENERYDLEQLNDNSYYNVAKFSWDQLNPLNDGHILSAAYLNFIGDIYVLCKQDPVTLNPPLIDRCCGARSSSIRKI